jgi:hypothetical protein
VNWLVDPIKLQRLEGLVVFLGGVWAWFVLGGSWWLLPLLLLPDIAMLGYLAGPRVGAAMYNLVHSYPLAGGLVAIGIALPSSLGLLAGVLLLIHIGGDRAMGYGLKLPSGFKDTHLNR